jgi:cell division protein FtsA
MSSQKSLIVSIDVGSSKIASLVVESSSEDDISFITSSTSKSEGFKSGSITDMQKAENTILNCIHELESLSKKNIQSANVVISGFGTKSYYFYQKIKLETDSVTQKDVNLLISKLVREFEQQNQEIIHYFPIEYSIDGQDQILNPIGMTGTELGCRIHIIAASKILLDNLSTCFANCQVKIDNVILGAYASGLSCLTNDEMQMGSLVIDLGSRTTSFGIFLDNKLIYSSYINIGSFHITSDVAKAFSIDFDTAEKIKIFYGKAIDNFGDKSYKIIEHEKLGCSYDSISHIRYDDISEVIIPRVEEIIEEVKKEYDKLGLDHLIARKIVITGGGSNLMYISDYVQKLFNKQTRIGEPEMFRNMNDSRNIISYPSSIGAVKYVAQINAKAYSSSLMKNKSIFGKVINWIKENI